MNNVHISQFYACSEIKLACELYYVCELGKYSKINCEHAVSLDGVLLNSVLKKSPIWEYFRLAVDEGWVVDTGVVDKDFAVTDNNPLEIDKSKIGNFLYVMEEVPFDKEDSDRRRMDFDYDIRTPLRAEISFEVVETDYWKWAMNGAENCHFIVNNKSLNHNHADQSWLSLIAMVAVSRQFGESPKYLWLEFNSDVVINRMALSYVIILADETNALDGWINLDPHLIDSSTYLQLSYTAWYAKGRDIGLCDRWYSGKEKFEYLKKLDIIEGDLVMLYERSKSQKRNYIKDISGCHLAKIVKLNDEEVTFDLINTVKPYSTGKADFDDHTIAVKRMYGSVKPYESLNHSGLHMTLADLGVEYLLRNEHYFITPLDESNDIKTVYVEDKDGNGVKLNLTQNNLAYWILKDYNYAFNEDRFLAKYFKYKEPVYTRFMRGDTLDAECYYKEDENA